jgi:4-amino-4-deoxy-L-arabinose transferase-like glycosyltransferase
MDASRSPTPAVSRPLALASWLPYLWSRVLFPGDSTAGAAGPAQRDWLWLLVLPAILLYPSLSFPLLEPDETRYAEVPREMLQRGDWIVPYLQGEPYLDKPPLTYWLVMLSYRVCGITEPAARLVPALALHGCVLLAYAFGRRWLGARAALRGALLLTLAPGFMSMGRLLILDGVLAFWITLSLGAAFEAGRGESWHRGWWTLAALSCGFGLLTKGPVALLLVIPPLLLARWLRGDAALSLRRWGWFLGVALVVAVPWYVAVCVRAPEFAGHFLWQHNVVRFVAPFDHVRPVWFYLPVVFLGLLPGTLLLVPFLRLLLTGDAEQARRRSPELGFVLLAGGWCLFFFSLAGSKLPTYILPALPWLALALGYTLALSRPQGSGFVRVLGGATFAILFLVHQFALPWYAEYRSPVSRPEAILQHCTDSTTPVVCYPRPCNAVAFYLGRDDLRNYRSKEIEELRDLVRRHPRTVILCTHRHSLLGLKQLLPPEVKVIEAASYGLRAIPGVPAPLMKAFRAFMGETALGLCALAVVERRAGGEETSEP